jgi:TIR domain
MTRSPSKVFINYRAADEPWAAVILDDALARRWGEEAVFLDNRSIAVGRLFDRELLANLRSSSILLVVIGPRWLTVRDTHGRRLIDSQTDWVRLEIAEGLANGIHVVPVLVGDLRPLDAAALPPRIRQLARCQYTRLRHRYRHQDLNEIAQRLLALDPGLRRRSA